MTTLTACSTKPLLQTPPPSVPGAWFDQDEVDRVVQFFKLLRFVKGKWRGVPFDLLDWQVEYLIAPVFGWKHPDGTRIVRTAWFEFPRKQGKSTLSSGLALKLLAADREPGAEVYAVAGDKDQARLVFDPAKEMVEGSPQLRKKLRIQRNVILAPGSGSVFRVLSSDARLKHGLNVHGAVIDEVHVHKTRDLIDAIETGTGSRDQPLVIFITTADEGDETSIYNEKREYVEKLAKGIVTDPTFYGVVFAAEHGDDPFAESTWEKANPGIDVTVKREYLRKEAAKAEATPGYLNTWLRLHLGIRTRQSTRWLDIAKWDATAGLVDVDKLKGRQCWGGLDLSSTTDLTALELVFPHDDGEHLDVVSHFWLPEDDLDSRIKRDKVPYDRWAKEGFLTLTEGNVVDYARVSTHVQEIAKTYKLMRLSYDRMFAGQLAIELELAGIETAQISQTYVGLSPASKELERLVLQARLHHGGNPVLRWNADCVEILTDSHNADNIRPVKPDRQRSTKRIDGIVALVMALDGWIRRPQRKARRVAGF